VSEGTISIEDFGKLQLRTAEVVSCEPHPNADKLLVLQVAVGEERRQIVAGIAESYAPADLVGQQIVIVANLKPAKLRGETSEGMLLAATSPDGVTRVLTVDGELAAGAKIR
jgi:methionyl-tRNA synthetase